MPGWQRLGALAASIAVCFSAAALGSLFTFASLPTWYAALAKPAWNPPNWLFGPVWSILYLSMAIALWLVWLRPGGPKTGAYWSFAIQLVLNASWSAVFFTLHMPAAAFAVISALWLAIAVTALLFGRISRPAGSLLVPYLAWVTFAALLNFAIWQLNR